tara:strand:- start:1073 stop:1225 length:153 start_codon:yes stop_codon:yes gene_type:complete
MQLEKLKINKIQDNWEVDIKVRINKDEADYWELMTKEEVEDFMHHILRPV